jgi:acetylornithine deacetylase
VGEPTELRVVTAHKGVYVHRTTVTGLEAHSSSLHRGVSAIYAANEIISEIMRMGAERRAAAQPDSGFDPPYTTFNVGTIAGGTAFNIVPRHCEFVWDIRLLPGDDLAALRGRISAFVERELLPRLRQVHPGASVVTEILAETPALVPDPTSPAEALARQLTGANATSTVAFASEAGIFREEGIPAVLCGPGSIDQAHQPNEYITLEQLAAGERFLRRLADWAESAR